MRFISSSQSPNFMKGICTWKVIFNWHNKGLITALDLLLNKETNTNFEMVFDKKYHSHLPILVAIETLLQSLMDIFYIFQIFVYYSTFQCSILFSKTYDKICSNGV